MKIFLFSIIFLSAVPCHSQLKNGALGPEKEESLGKIKVFVDCSVCDISDIKQNIQFVNYVRDRKDADVYMLITSIKTGGGTEYSFFIFGQKEFLPRLTPFYLTQARRTQ